MAAINDTSRSPLSIHKRTTLRGNGDVLLERTVHCPRQGGSVDLADCLRCPQCQGAERIDAGEPAALNCDHDGTRVEDLVAAAGPALAATRAARIPVSAIMTAGVVCVQGDLSADALAALLLARGFNGAPVVDEKGRAIGIVSGTDLVRQRHEAERFAERQAPQVRQRRAVEHDFGRGDDAGRTTPTTAADVMTPIAFALPESATIAEAAAIMSFEGVHRVPVVSPSGQVAGILSSLDILGWLAEQAGWLVARTQNEKKGQ